MGYRIDVAQADGPFTVEAEPWYQPIGYRWAHNLGDQRAEDIKRFISYYNEAAESSAVVLASTKAVADETSRRAPIGGSTRSPLPGDRSHYLCEAKTTRDRAKERTTLSEAHSD
ncbi:MAG: hypothetical protein P8127_14435 [Acidobacteriota bacterium]